MANYIPENAPVPLGGGDIPATPKPLRPRAAGAVKRSAFLLMMLGLVHLLLGLAGLFLGILILVALYTGSASNAKKNESFWDSGSITRDSYEERTTPQMRANMAVEWTGIKLSLLGGSSLLVAFLNLVGGAGMPRLRLHNFAISGSLLTMLWGMVVTALALCSLSQRPSENEAFILFAVIGLAFLSCGIGLFALRELLTPETKAQFKAMIQYLGKHCAG